MVTATVSAMGQVRAWIREEMVRGDEIKEPEIVDEVVARLEGDGVILHRYVWLGVYQLVREILSEGRRMEGESGLFRAGDVVVSREVMDGWASKLAKRFDIWFEDVGGRQVRLKAMTRADLVVAESLRRKRIATESQRADFLHELAERMEDDERTVGERFTDEGLETIRVMIEKEEVV